MKGGLRVVVFTDALQAGILMLAAIAVTGFRLHRAGGLDYRSYTIRAGDVQDDQTGNI